MGPGKLCLMCILLVVVSSEVDVRFGHWLNDLVCDSRPLALRKTPLRLLRFIPSLRPRLCGGGLVLLLYGLLFGQLCRNLQRRPRFPGQLRRLNGRSVYSERSGRGAGLSMLALALFSSSADSRASPLDGVETTTPSALPWAVTAINASSSEEEALSVPPGLSAPGSCLASSSRL